MCEDTGAPVPVGAILAAAAGVAAAGGVIAAVEFLASVEWVIGLAVGAVAVAMVTLAVRGVRHPRYTLTRPAAAHAPQPPRLAIEAPRLAIGTSPVKIAPYARAREEVIGTCR